MRKVEGEPYADVLGWCCCARCNRPATQNITMATMGLLRNIMPTLPVPSAGIRTDGSSNGANTANPKKWQNTLNKSFQTLPANPLVGERRAIDAEREAAMKKAEHMEDYVGEEYDAVVLVCGEIWPFGDCQIRLKAWSILPISLNSTILMKDLTLRGENQE